MIPQRAGNLNKRVTLERRDETDDDVGEPIPTWTQYAEVWAHFAPQYGTEGVAEGQIHAVRSTRITIRYRGDVLPTDRVMHQAVPYNIEAILEPERLRDALVLVCSDGANAG